MNMKRSSTNNGTLFIISAPSGAGKTTLVNAVLEKIAGTYSLNRLVTYTTKLPRAGEKNGIDYHFLTEQEFKRFIERNLFLEWSCSYGSYYGTPRSLIDDLSSGQSYFAIVDRSGAQVLSSFIERSVRIWIHTKNMAILETRLKTRGTESPDVIAKRLAIAQTEIDQENKNRFYDHHILNDIFEIAINELKAIIIGTLENGDCRRNSNNFCFMQKDF